jgi:hypothetical protein
MSPITYQVSVATLMQVRDAYWLRHFGPAGVAAFESTVVVPLVTAFTVT